MNLDEKKNILLIEDNRIDEKLTVRALQGNGLDLEVAIVRNGADAIEFLQCKGKYIERANVNLPCLIFLDLKVPKVSGFEILKSIRDNEQTRLIPVVVLTSSVEKRDLIESYSLGANSYVRKQVNFEQFLVTIKQVCHYWLSINEGPPLSLGKKREAS
jgi:two-component system response regulator